VLLVPELEQLQRTWMLTGKLDYAEGRASLRERFFRAAQMASRRDWVAVLTARTAELAPITSAADDHLTLSAFPESYATADLLEATLTSALDEGPLGSALPSNVYMDGSKLEMRRAVATSGALVAEAQGAHRALHVQATELWTNVALENTLWGPVFPDAGRYGYWPPQHQGAAMDAWRRAAQLAPRRADVAFGLAAGRARQQPGRPELVEAELTRALPWLADEVLRADLRITLGHAAFGAGALDRARWQYMRSLDDFNLPKLINVRGQKAAGGL
jgi:hypothetical protein